MQSQISVHIKRRHRTQRACPLQSDHFHHKRHASARSTVRAYDTANMINRVCRRKSISKESFSDDDMRTFVDQPVVVLAVVKMEALGRKDSRQVFRMIRTGLVCHHPPSMAFFSSTLSPYASPLRTFGCPSQLRHVVARLCS